MTSKRRRVDEPDSVAKRPNKVRKKGERPRCENTERAFIAASRRSDRSIEARVQSAMEASRVHKERTGKALKVTEEIVRKEEMYEEEEDDLPRHYRALPLHLRTSSPMMNNRAGAYVTSQMATAAYVQQVEEEFARHFPNVPIVSRRLQGIYGQSLPLDPSPAPQSYKPRPRPGSTPAPQFYQPRPHPGSTPPPPPVGYHPHHRSPSVPQMAPQPQMFPQFDHQSPMSGQYESSDDALPALTPTSNNADTPNSSSTPPVFHPDDFGSRGLLSPGLPVDPSFGASNANFTFPFTSAMPTNIKNMADMDPLDPLQPFYMGFVGGELVGSDAAMFPPFIPPPRRILNPSTKYQSIPATGVEPSQAGDAPQPIRDASQSIGEDLPSMQQGSQIDTPDPNAANESWKVWLADYEEGGSEES